MWGIMRFVGKHDWSWFQHARYFSVTNTLKKSHYDVLGLTPKATQNDIKTAYYKLSKMYHPDINKEVDAASSFRDITAAYEVLGNYKLRKLYDRGLLPSAELGHPTHVRENPEDSFYQSRENRHRAPTSSGRTPNYDFDEWAREHYGRSFARRADAKHRWEKGIKSTVTNKGDVQSEITISTILLMFIAFFFIAKSFSSDYDVDQTKSSGEKSDTSQSS